MPVVELHDARAVLADVNCPEHGTYYTLILRLPFSKDTRHLGREGVHARIDPRPIGHSTLRSSERRGIRRKYQVASTDALLSEHLPLSAERVPERAFRDCFEWY